MRKSIALAGAGALLALVAYLMLWSAVDEFRWDRPAYAVWSILVALLVAERLRWLLPVASRGRRE